MIFGLDDGQIDLQQTVAKFFADRFALDAIASREGALSDRALWREMADLGMFGLLLPEKEGGSGLGVVEAALLFEQIGSHLVSGPLLWTVLAAPFVAGAVTGEQLVGGVNAHDIVNGSAVVEHAGDLDLLLVLGADGIVLHERGALHGPYALDPLDPLTPLGRFDRIGSGNVVAGPETAAHLDVLGTVLCAAELVGVSSRALDVARTYALEREQFGAPIGSFQAIKHILADMYVRSEMAQSATYAAAAMLDQIGNVDAPRAAAAAKLLASESALANGAAAVQVLGGMGFTWDMLPNYLVKRAWVLEQSFGSADDHALSVGEMVAEGES